MNLRFLSTLKATVLVPCSAIACVAMMLVPVTNAAEPFGFKANDVVAIYGNGLADRMQHDPWVETVLQSHLKGMNVSFRNMSFSGDLVNKRPRNKGFTNDGEYLQHVAPSVVFSFYLSLIHI